MHRLKSPLIALIAVLIAAGPLAGRISQTNGNDPYQISTPSAWERSQGLAENETTVELEFHHGVQAIDDPVAPVEELEDQILLYGEDRVASLDRETLTIAWEIELPFWADPAHRSFVLDELTGEESRHVIVGNSSTHAMIDIDTGTLQWVKDKPYVEFSSRYDAIGMGLVLFYEETDEFRYVGARLLNATTGEILTVFPETGRPYIEALGDVYLVETDYEIFAASSASGQRLWSFPLPDNNADVTLSGDVTLIHNDEELIGLDPSSGQEMWLLYVQPGAWISDSDASIALLLSEGEVVSIDLQTGLELQRMPTLGGDSWQPYLRGERLINPDEQGVALIDARSGEEIWRLDGPAIEFANVRQEDQAILQSPSGTFVVMDNATGELLWRDEGTVLGSVGDTSILWSAGNEIAVRDISDGSPIWSYTSADPVIEAKAGYGYVAVTTAFDIIWLDDETGDVTQETARMIEWEEIRPAGRLFFVTNPNGVTMHDPVSGRQWELPGATYQGNLGWGSSGDYFTVDFSVQGEKRHFWLFRLSTGELLWENYSADRVEGLYDAADGVVIVYNETWPDSGEGTAIQLNPDGTIGWEAPVDGEVTGISRYEEHGKIVFTLALGTLVLDEETGKTVLYTDNSNDPGMNTTTLFYAWVQFAPGRIFEPGMTVSRVYRTSDALPEVLKDDTVLRGAPNASAVERGTFPAGTEVTRTGNEREGTDGLWLEVTIDGTTGWVPRDALTDAPSPPPATPVG